MVHRHFIQSSAYAQAHSDATKVVSIVGLGGDDHRVVIELPRDHQLVKHLEQLIPAANASQQPTQAQPLTHILPPLSQYIPSNIRYGTSASLFGGSLSVPTSPQTTRKRRRRGSNGSTKRCHFVGCDNFSVSHGLCRRHGGGRRCQYVGCSKSAQSRTNFCWSHGGGLRCEVKNCMRGRKSKRFCAAHSDREPTLPASRDAEHRSRSAMHLLPRNSSGIPVLPSLLRVSQLT